MARNANRLIDKTFLSLDLAEERGLIHRDYIAHCFRWSHVIKFLNQGHKYKEAIMLDVGCGKEMPLAKTMYVNKMTPKSYVGVDMNDFKIPKMLDDKKIPISIWTETDFCELGREDVGVLVGENIDVGELTRKQRENYLSPEKKLYQLPNIVTCFEVLEHVTPEHCRRMIKHFGEVTAPDCHYFVSTPCFNGEAAENHINEMTFPALGSLIEELGYRIQGVYGTFASIADYKDQLSSVTTYDMSTGKVLAITDIAPVFAALRNYYDTNALSVIFAPLFPAYSRNCLWHFVRDASLDPGQGRMFSRLEQVSEPGSQHPDWRALGVVTTNEVDQ